MVASIGVSVLYFGKYGPCYGEIWDEIYKLHRDSLKILDERPETLISIFSVSVIGILLKMITTMYHPLYFETYIRKITE